MDKIPFTCSYWCTYLDNTNSISLFIDLLLLLAILESVSIKLTGRRKENGVK